MGALAGAWLGFHAAPVSLAMLTTIAGAVAGSNLALIGVDVWRTRSGATTPAAAVEDVPSEPPAAVTIGMP